MLVLTRMEPQHTILLSIKPKINNGKDVSSLDIALSINAPNLNPESILLTLQTSHDNTPSTHYGPDDILAFDSKGSLALSTSTTVMKDRQTWNVARATSGTITVLFNATPRYVDIDTPSGGRVDLRADSGGVQGAGMSFIPLPLWAEDNELLCRTGVEWDLSHCPQGTRAIWTFGEGPALIEKEYNCTYHIWSAQFMVGPILSYPETPGDFGMYWFGKSTPAEIVDLGPLNARIFGYMADFFEPDTLGREPYRIFVRHVPHGFGGTGLSRSYVLEYDDTISSYPTAYIIFLLSHEMVHNWLIIDFEDDGLENNWYVEGIANYYGVMIPWRHGILDAEDCVAYVNETLVSYYTSPYRSLPEGELLDWGNVLKIQLPYARGFAFLLKMDALIRKSSAGAASLDDVALDLLHKRNNGEIVQQKEWIASVKQFLGETKAKQMLSAMLNGELVILPPDTLEGYRGLCVGKEPFDLGFSVPSFFSKRVVEDVVKGSRADEAGVKDGDRIVSATRLWLIMEDFDKLMELTLKRGEENISIKYWPRGQEKVDCWQFVLMDKTLFGPASM
jgi:hypothetical protein